MNRLLVPLGALFTLAAVGTTFGTAGAAPVQAVIDFQAGLSAGDIVSTLTAGQGISGADAGSVSVFGTRSNLPGVNQAMVFDSACGGAQATCSGGDRDLYQPANGNTLIISEDNDSSDPDDADVGERINFDFSAWGPGVVRVVSIDVLDVELDESPGQIAMSGSAITIPDIGDGNVRTLQIGFTGSLLEVILNGSGAIDNIVIEYEPVVVETTTPPTQPTTAPTEPTTAPTEPTTPPTDPATTVAPTTDPATTVAPTTVPPTATPTSGVATTTGPSVSAFPPPPPTTPTTQLPATGSSSPATLLFAGLAALCFGTALVQFARRSPEAG